MDNVKNMNREKQIAESIEHLEQVMDESTRDAKTQEQVTNMALTGIMHNLMDISMTLAIIADELKEEEIWL